MVLNGEGLGSGFSERRLLNLLSLFRWLPWVTHRKGADPCARQRAPRQHKRPSHNSCCAFLLQARTLLWSSRRSSWWRTANTPTSWPISAAICGKLVSPITWSLILYSSTARQVLSSRSAQVCPCIWGGFGCASACGSIVVQTAPIKTEMWSRLESIKTKTKTLYIKGKSPQSNTKMTSLFFFYLSLLLNGTANISFQQGDFQSFSLTFRYLANYY